VVSAQPLDPSNEPEPAYSDDNADVDADALNDSMSDMETRLSRQILLLQRQIDQLARRVEELELDSPE
jgi:hypothetical protein